jgi:hypothetical protein
MLSFFPLLNKLNNLLIIDFLSLHLALSRQYPEKVRDGNDTWFIMLSIDTLRISSNNGNKPDLPPYALLGVINQNISVSS